MSKSKKRQLDKADFEPPKKKAVGGHWSAGLLVAMSDPNLKVMEDERVVVIRDKYPKAIHHYLVLPKDDISSLKKVTKDHLDLLKYMSKIGRKISKKYPDSNFKVGYHAQASMSRLHLHIISDDFYSPGLKTKKHWNSFTTQFFISDTDVIQDVEKDGHVTMKTEEQCKKLLSRGLTCHKCNYASQTIPQLKRHLLDIHDHNKEKE